MKTSDSTSDLAQTVRRGAPSVVRVRSAFRTEPVPTRREAPRVTPFREFLASDHLDLTVDVLHLRRLVDARPRPAPYTARGFVADRLGDLDDVRDALEDLLAEADEPMDRLLAPSTSLSAYLRGLFLYCEGLVEALEHLLAAADRGHVEWRTFSERAGRSSQFFFDGLVQAVRQELEGEPRSASVDEKVEQLFFSASILHTRSTRPAPVLTP